MMSPPPAITERGKRRGFNLIEAAIVLGVVGLVIGGIWVAASAVNQAMKINTLYGGIVSAMANMQKVYNNTSMANGALEVTTAMCKADVFSASAFTFNNNCTNAISPLTPITHNLPLGTSLGFPGVLAYTQGCCGASYSFALMIANLTTTDCINLLMKFNSAGQGNIVSLAVYGDTNIVPYNSAVPDTVITLAEAKTACQPAAVARTITLTFKK